ncbi:MAG: cytochrome P450 [Gammaproteobacteria bacterium]
MAAIQARIPAHVPAQLVVDFDLWNFAQGEPHDAFGHYERLVARGVPEIFWTPANGGHWVFTRYEAIREGYQNHEAFTSFPAGIPLVPGKDYALIPNELDPPEHTIYRTIMNRMFSPAAMAQMQARIRSLAVELIDPLVDRGACDFAESYALRLPNILFLYLMGLPLDMMPKFLEWEHGFFRGKDIAEKQQAAESIMAYLAEYVAQQARAPGEGVIGALLRTRLPDGREFSQLEVVRTAHLLYLAGLDTVANTLSFIWKHLAEHPQTRREIAADPSRIPNFTVEMLRIYGIACLTRRAKADTVFRGVAMKAGDAVLLPTCLANRDPEVFPHPLEVDIHRDNKAFITFGAGPHRCLGSHLARQEIDISLQEWFRRIPDFEIPPGAPVESALGLTLGMYALPLRWPARIA